MLDYYCHTVHWLQGKEFTLPNGKEKQEKQRLDNHINVKSDNLNPLPPLVCKQLKGENDPLTKMINIHVFFIKELFFVFQDI